MIVLIVRLATILALRVCRRQRAGHGLDRAHCLTLRLR
jgi:hypothetical protein